MSHDLGHLKEQYEAADAEALKLSGQYQKKYQDGIRKLKEKLTDQYGERIAEANERARTAQKEYMDALVLEDLVERDERAVADRLVNEGSLSGDQVEEAFGS